MFTPRVTRTAAALALAGAAAGAHAQQYTATVLNPPAGASWTSSAGRGVRSSPQVSSQYETEA